MKAISTAVEKLIVHGRRRVAERLLKIGVFQIGVLREQGCAIGVGG